MRLLQNTDQEFYTFCVSSAKFSFEASEKAVSAFDKAIEAAAEQGIANTHQLAEHLLSACRESRTAVYSQLTTLSLPATSA